MKWIPENIPVIVNGELPTASLISLDLEYDENASEIVCVGMFDGTSYYHFSSVSEPLLRYLREVRWIGQDITHAELPMLNKLYGGFSTDRIYADVKILAYVYDSTLRDWGLKNLAKKYLSVEWPKYSELKKEHKFKNIKELPPEVLQDYNGSDCVFTWRLWEFYKKNFNQIQWWFYNNLELPTTRLLYEVESGGILVDTVQAVELHREYLKKANKAKKEFKRLAGL